MQKKIVGFSRIASPNAQHVRISKLQSSSVLNNQAGNSNCQSRNGINAISFLSKYLHFTTIFHQKITHM